MTTLSAAIEQFLHDPIVLGLWSLAIVSLAVFALTVWRSLSSDPPTFDASRLPRILTTLVLNKLVPLAVIGVTAALVTDEATKSALTVAYGGAWLLAMTAETKQLVDAVRGEDHGLHLPIDGPTDPGAGG